MKKVLIIILSLILILSFAGCKTDTANKEDGFSNPENNSVFSEGDTSKDDNQSKDDKVNSSSSSNATSGNKTSYGSSTQKSDENNYSNDYASGNKTSSGSSTQKSDENNYSDDYASSNITTENVKINSLDKLNFYAVKKAIAENGVVLLSNSAQKPKVATLANNRSFRLLNLANSTATNINANSTFTITMYSYFTITLNDTRGFLAQKLGGTGSVEVVISRNNFNNMITFKKGERYYSCFQTSLTEKAMSFSSHKYVSGYKLVENYEQENYEFTVYFEGDKVIGMNCGRFKEGSNYKYTADDITFNDNFCIVVHKKQSFTAEQLEDLFASNNSFVDDGIVLNDGTVLFGESSVTDNSIALKNKSGASVITNNHIKKVSAMHNSKFGFCIRLELNSGVNISGKTNLSFYLNNSKDRELTLKNDGSAVYIIDLNNKSRMSDVFYKLTAINTNNRIGRIIDHDDFVREASKRLNLNDYDVLKEDYSASFGNGLKIVDYTYDLKTNKSISHKVSNYDMTIDGITITMPIKVSDFLSKGFTVKEKFFDDSILQGSAFFKSSDGNMVTAYIMNFYGNSSNFNDCYITQIDFSCYEDTLIYQEGISPTRPDFEMIEGINKDSTLDDIISRLGEPNKIILMTTDNQPMNYKDCVIQLYYKVYIPSLPNGELVFNLQPVLNSNTPSDFLTDISFSLQ